MGAAVRRLRKGQKGPSSEHLLVLPELLVKRIPPDRLALSIFAARPSEQ